MKSRMDDHDARAVPRRIMPMKMERQPADIFCQHLKKNCILKNNFCYTCCNEGLLFEVSYERNVLSIHVDGLSFRSCIVT